MLKVLHTGDWHIGSFPGPEVGGQNARFQDICRCLDFQAMYAEEHRPDLIVVSGDIFHQARVWSDRGLRESRTAIDHIRRLSNLAPTVVLRGTPNHDSEEQFEMLTTAFYGDDSVSVVTEPEVIHIHTYHGQRVDVACIPGFDRGVHRAAHPGLSREEETQVFTDELAKVVLGLKAQCEPGVTSILSTHFTVPGCNMESGQTALFAQFEPVIYQDTLKAADFDLVALGHIGPDTPAVSVTRFGSRLSVPLCAGCKTTEKKTLHLVGAGQTPQQRVELVALVAVERLEECVNLLFGLDNLLNPDV